MRARDGVAFAANFEEVCRNPDVDFVDWCTLPEMRLPVVEACARFGKHIQVQKPVAADLATARKMIDTAKQAGILLNVVSQHRFDDASQFLSHALPADRLGKLLQCDCYVKWHRPVAYYSRPIKGSLSSEGWGALINPALNQHAIRP